jgi:hypothetical protein
VGENAMSQTKKRHRRPSYRAGDPNRRLLAAILLRAANDLSSPSAQRRARARDFLQDEEGLAWLRYFGIRLETVRRFLSSKGE